MGSEQDEAYSLWYPHQFHLSILTATTRDGERPIVQIPTSQAEHFEVEPYRRVTIVTSQQFALRNKDLSRSLSILLVLLLDMENWKTARLQSSSSHTGMTRHREWPVTHVWGNLKPQVSAKPTLKGRSWCFKLLNMVNQLMGLHYCSHWLSFQHRLWKCNAFMPCLHHRHCSKEVASNKCILLPSFFLCSSVSTDCRNKVVQSHW